jgi:serine-type D-Ala-D-Ala carboxypeptidase/endopeptidase (penicillin-binding protein 4)
VKIITKYYSLVFVSIILIILIPQLLFQKSPDEDIFLPDVPENVYKKSIVNLKNSIDKVLNNKGLKNTDMGIAVYSFDEKEYYYEKNIFKPLTPASTTKLFTTFAALYTLGNNYYVKTSVYYDGVIKNGVLYGDIYLYGRGDALFSVSDMDLLAKKIHDLGVRKITGNIYGDDSYFDNVTDRKEYSNDLDVVEPLPPITALSIERNTATIIATSGAKSNQPLHITIIPNSESFIIENHSSIRTGRIKEAIDDRIYPRNLKSIGKSVLENVGDCPPLPRRRRGTVRITSQELKDDKQKFIIKGYLYQGQSYSYMYFIQSPALAAAGALKSSLRNFNIEVKGNIGRAKISDLKNTPSVLAEFRRPIMELVQLANKESDNFMAENLFKIVGAYAGSSTNTSRKSNAIKQMIFDSLGIAFDDCLINDGSGLSRRNLVTAKSLITMLVKAQYMPFADDFYNSLAIAGIDGTLYKRMAATVAENNVCAKTGTLRNVSALAGYVSTMDGELLAFAFLFNGPYVYNYKLAEDELALLLASFFYER